jgi:hypothetical protein
MSNEIDIYTWFITGEMDLVVDFIFNSPFAKLPFLAKYFVSIPKSTLIE